MKKYFSAIICVLLSQASMAQGEAPAGASGNDFMGGNLKIYVALAVLTIILSFIFLFLFRMERRLKDLEKKGEG